MSILVKLQKRSLRATDKVDRLTPVLEMRVAFRIPYVYNYIAKLWGKYTKAIQNELNSNVRGIGQEGAMRRSVGGLNLAAVKPTTIQVAKCRPRVEK
jgi:hypothetical protein